VASVALWCGRNGRGFSNVAGKTGCGGGTSVRCGAGQGWRHVRDSMSCMRACIARLEGAWVHGNALPAPDALGGQFATRWQGRGVAHARPRADRSRGIDHWGQNEAGGEVTTQEVDGGALPRLGVHGGQWRCPGAAWGG
jgi:hypothetical protein